MKILTLSLIAFIASSAFAQDSRPAGRPGGDPAVLAQREALKKLDFLVGRWTGSGWMEMGPGNKREFHGTEIVQKKLDGLLITVEGTHKGNMNGQEVVVHNAFAVVSYNDKRQTYNWEAFANGNRIDTEAAVGENSLRWGTEFPGIANVRYTIKLDAKGRWYEIGERSRDGQQWVKFFEMTMTKEPA
jgi:hypothetical protein